MALATNPAAVTFAPQTPASERATGLRIDYVPRPGLLRICLVNALLGLLTLTVYRFWARTRVRRHIWSCIHINGEALEYTGRGSELFLGALIVFGLFVLPTVLAVMAVQIAFGPDHPLIAAVQGVVFLIAFILWGMAVYRARRYQLSRTLWRGIRGALVGSSWTYTWLYAGAVLLKFVTLGWATPAMNLNLQERLIGDMRFGSAPFRFQGEAGPLYPAYALSWCLAALTLLIVIAAGAALIMGLFGTAITTLIEAITREDHAPGPTEAWTIVALIYGGLGVLAAAWLAQSFAWAFYVAREANLFASYTELGGARFGLKASAGSLLLLWIGNLLIVLFTLGIATPFAQQRTIRYFCERMDVQGTVDLGDILQSREPVQERGEGLADALDVGGI